MFTKKCSNSFMRQNYIKSFKEMKMKPWVFLFDERFYVLFLRELTFDPKDGCHVSRFLWRDRNRCLAVSIILKFDLSTFSSFTSSCASLWRLISFCLASLFCSIVLDFIVITLMILVVFEKFCTSDKLIGMKEEKVRGKIVLLFIRFPWFSRNLNINALHFILDNSSIYSFFRDFLCLLTN